MDKFVCNCSGKCCRNFDGSSIGIFNDEAKRLKEIAEKRRIKIFLSKDKLFFDEISGKNFFSSQRLKGNPCPFLGKNNQCTVYEDRPLVCRAFPLKFSREKEFIVSKFCCPVKSCANLSEAKEFFGEETVNALEEINRRLDSIDYDLKWKEDEGEMKISEAKEGVEEVEVERLLKNEDKGS